MKQLQKNKRWLIPSIGKPLLTLLICIMSLTMVKAQLTGTITPLTNTVITNACDLQLCGAWNNSGNPLSDPLVFTIDVPLFAGSGYNNITSWNIMTTPFCKKTLSFNDYYSNYNNISIGVHKIYLLQHPVSGNDIVLDSIEVNIINPITLSVTTGSITGATSGEQYITVSNLNPSDTYTLSFDIETAPNYSVITTGSSTFSYTFNPPHACFYSYTLTTNSACSNGIYLDTILAFNDPCSYSHAYEYLYTNTFCSSDTISFEGILNSFNITTNDNLSYYVNWCDLTALNTSTVNYPSYSGYLVFPGTFRHQYLTPGSYTIKTWVVDNTNPICVQDTNYINITINPCGNLQGTVYYDANNNCTQDGSENGIGNIEVKVTQGSNVYYAWTNYLGYYNFYNIGIGAYTIEIGNNSSGYSVICANSQAHGTTVNASSVTTENFALNCSSQFDVATNGIYLLQGFYPGGTDAILPHVGLYNAACSFSISGQVKIILDPCIKYDPTSIIATNYGFTNLPDAVILAPTGDTLVWNVSNINNMGGFGYWDYPIAVTTCTNAQVGDTVCITVMVLPTNGDANVSNNNFTRCFAIGVAYDPNFKEVSPKGLGVEGYIPANTPELVYTINFQNTGTASAHNIYVLDTISNNLDYSTLQVLSSSHPMQTYEIGNKALKFMFANIMLPDSTSDEAHSHGYVTYKIKPKANLAAATKIKNTGYIYFDYNSPIVTNTTLNTIELTAGINELSLNSNINLYPNPASSQMVLQSKTEIATVRVFDITGKELVNTKVGSTKQYSLNISSFDNGTYLVEITNNNEEKAVKRFVKISE